MQFEFATAGKILFGAGSARQLPVLARELGKRVLVVTGQSGRGRAGALLGPLEGDQAPVFLAVRGEPSIQTVREGLELARRECCDSVLALGGGSVIDTGKAIAGLLKNPGPIEDYLEIIGRGRPLALPAAPWVAVPATAGAGAEVTRNAVLRSPEHGLKVSLRSPLLLARLALVDPELTVSLPPALTASTGMDALTQLIEPFLSNKANPLSDGFCREGIPRAARSLPRAFHDGEDLEARTGMALSALLGGLALANAGLGAVHGFAAPIGGMFSAPHGAVCAALLPHVLRVNLQALRRRQPRHPALERFQELAGLVAPSPQARAEDALVWARETCRRLRIPPLASYGIDSPQVPRLVELAGRSSSMRGNPLPLLESELEQILEGAIESSG